MALLAEYALTPDVFDSAAHSSEEVCGIHLQNLKEVLLNEGIVRNLHNGEWMRTFGDLRQTWHLRGKEFLKKLINQKRIVLAPAIRSSPPATDAEWCEEALNSHTSRAMAGVITTKGTAAQHRGNAIVSSVSDLPSASWWQARSPSLRLQRTLADYKAALDAVLRHANSLMFIDPYIDPTDHYQYDDLMAILASLQTRSVKPLIEIHRAAWYSGGQDKRRRISEVDDALRPSLQTLATTAGLHIEVFLWDDIHDRYLITDLIGISIQYGFGTTRAPDAIATAWTRLSRADRDSVQREFHPSKRSPAHQFTLK